MKIISLAPSITETLCALGCAEDLAGRTSFCDCSETIEKVPVVGGFKDVKEEIIEVLKPDLVIGTSLHVRIFDKLEMKSIRCIQIPSLPLFRAPEMILHLGNAVGKHREARKLAADVNELIKNVIEKAARLPQRRVIYLCDIYCPNWVQCTIASAVKSLNCQPIGRENNMLTTEIVMTMIADKKPDLILIPEEYEQEAQQILEGVPVKEYAADFNPSIRVFSSKNLGRTGAGSGKALEMLFKTIFE